jgi:hypothetical protein
MTLDDSAPSAPRWARRLTPEERAAELAREERAVNGDIRRAFVGALCGCAFWLTAGLVAMGCGLHTTDPELGGIAFLAGLIIGYSGLTVTLARYYVRGEREGWW